ncbi:Adenylate kinase [Zostera marina]|uniref:adenylate kinase n=1 Tax=Zostera marina TaxID=29655 RepID=A0A0K9NS24_ZOSMR|nr:Adenylate kinase [Zostera marina]
MAGVNPHHFLRRLASLLPRTPSCRFASTAVQLQYDSDYDEDSDQERHLALADKCGNAEGRDVRWVFIGSPGIQKHVYASRISKLLDVPYISIGSLVRQELHPRSSLYKKIANAVNEGKLVPEDIIFLLLSNRLSEGYHRGESGFILDGMPKTRVQAELLDRISDIDLVLNFTYTDHYFKKDSNDVCSYCGKSCFTTRTQCDQLISTQGTTEGTCLEKPCVYREQSRSLEEYYRKQRKLLDFHVSGGVNETWQGLLSVLDLQQVDALDSSYS